MLQRPSSQIRTRDFAALGLAVLLPLVFAALVGYRALVNESAARQREVEVEIGATARQLRTKLLDEIDASSARLSKAELPAEPGTALQEIERAMPTFAVAFVMGSDGTLRLPAPAELSEPNAECDESARRISLRLDDAEREKLAQKLVNDCPDVRSVSGRYLLPALVFDGLTNVDGARFSSWLEKHAASLSAAERSATEHALSTVPWLDANGKARALDLLRGQSSDRDELTRKLADTAARRAVTQLDSETPISKWNSDGAVGVLRRIDDKLIAGFLVTPRALGRAAPSFPLPAQLVIAPSEPSGPHAAAELAQGLTLVVGLADPRHVERLTSESRRWLVSSALLLAALALVFGGVALSRVRAARRLSELRTDFVSTVSHELRTPIASVSMLAELLEQGRVEESERAEVHQALAKEARRLGETVDRLLGFSRMSAGRSTTSRRELRLADPVRESLAAFEERHPGVVVERAIDGELSLVADADQIRLAVDNLLANAIKYAPDGQPYRVSVEARGKDALISVADRGPGVAPRDRKRIFEPFERADDRLSRATEGSGIGLGLVRHVAEAHGGRAWVEANPDSDQGARFVVALPRGVA
ncbi:MAG: HAMP domain-containing histidine kinase [Myxococcales bacterium]|nr:HAMP domain-containing histidine kinase [Myxococcales bacterium]